MLPLRRRLDREDLERGGDGAPSTASVLQGQAMAAFRTVAGFGYALGFWNMACTTLLGIWFLVERVPLSLPAEAEGGQSVGCHADNAKGERSRNIGYATILPCPNLSGRRRSAVAAARSHRKSPEKPMCSQVSGEVWASSASGTGLPWFCRCCTASAR